MEFVVATPTAPCINTEIIPNSTTKIELEVGNVSNDWFIFGERTAYDQNSFIVGYSGTNFYFDYGSRLIPTDTPALASNRYVIIKEGRNNKVYLNRSLLYDKTNSTASFNPTIPIAIGTIIDSNGIIYPSRTDGTQNCSRRFYYVKIWQNNSLVRDFIPVRCGSIGFMYDQVSGKLFGNSGTGSFVLGPDVQP